VIGLDTNVLVRYLAQDDSAQSAIATRLIEQTLSVERPGFVSLIVLAELCWVMESCYDCSSSDVADTLETLLRARQLKVEDSDIAWQALRIFRAGKSDFADCLIARIGHARECGQTVTFDKAAASTAGMSLLSG
jgi:predicted nucleic-acid-binding protein